MAVRMGDGQASVEIILLCVRWYCNYEISYRDLVEMMQQRFSKSTLPHSSVRITRNRAPVSITSVTNGMSERERDFPQACNGAAFSSAVIARPTSPASATSSHPVAAAPLGRSVSGWPEASLTPGRRPTAR